MWARALLAAVILDRAWVRACGLVFVEALARVDTGFALIDIAFEEGGDLALNGAGIFGAWIHDADVVCGC